MGIVARALRNISRRKMKSLLVILALGFALAMMISLPPGITANQAAAQSAINTIQAASNAVNATLSRAATEIDCSLPPTFTAPSWEAEPRLLEAEVQDTSSTLADRHQEITAA